MKKQFQFILSTLLVVSILLGASFTPEENNITWERERVEKGEIIEVQFNYPVTNMDIPDGFKYLGYENGIYRFEALKDMNNVKGYLFYSKSSGEDTNIEEEDDNTHHGEAGSGEGTEIDWGSFDLGKHSWKLKDGSIQYAIRIDLDKYRELDYIILEDTPSENLKLISEINVNKLNPNENNKVENDGLLQVEKEEKGNGFVLKIPITDDKALDIVYYMSPTNQDDISNRYKIYSIREWEMEQSGGSIVGEDGSNESTPPEDPGTPSKPPKEPTPPEVPPTEPTEPETPPTKPIEPEEPPTEPETPPTKPIEPEEPPKEIEEPEEPPVETEKPPIDNETEPTDNELKIPKKELETQPRKDMDDIPKAGKLPKTGVKEGMGYAMTGLLLLIIGFILLDEE